MTDLSSFRSCGEDLYWHGCYGSEGKYKKFVTPESYAHPAKCSFLLLDKIFQHLKKLGLLHEDSVVCDFLAGTGRTNIMAALNGYNTIAVELEPHFVKMIEGNRNRYQHLTGKSDGWEIIQGDARNLSQILQGGCVGVVSPPYSDAIAPRGGECLLERVGISTKTARRYSNSQRQIGNLPDKSLVGITSPPYTDIGHIAGDNANTELNPKRLEMQRRYTETMRSEGNIQKLPDKGLVGITSPPYEDAMGIKHTDCDSSKKLYEEKHWNTKYSTNRENIGAVGGETYLEAMLKVYREAYLAGISPLVTITKNPTRNFKLRRLDIDTVKLLMMAGYEIIDYHRAVLFEEKQQLTLTGDIVKIPKGRLGFFKRLSYNKGNVTAKWEDVIIAIGL
jgi:hypothetical protein